ncbi:MAG: Ppx/GppA phosphatase family protein [candidate division KSB1 bacterium]|nr:Ppx/GppA phosphatase family protein [candidate division KSB1 bacterium]
MVDSNRLATIDLGTNTFLLLISEWRDGELCPVFQTAKIVRIGEDVDRTGRFGETPMQRALDCLRRFADLAQEHGARPILACGTSAFRDASNRDAFIQRVRHEIGINIRVISGEKEAEYSYLGALSNKRNLPDPYLMLDIGGGSTELCWGDRDRMTGRLSLDMGSVRLTERLLRHDPVLPEELEQARASIEKVLREQVRLPEPFAMRDHQTGTFLGVAGTVTTLAAMLHKVEPYVANRIDGSRLPLAAVQALISEIAKRSIQERKRMIGLSPKRADVILAGALILEAVMQFVQRDSIIVSDRGLRYGMALEFFQNKPTV